MRIMTVSILALMLLPATFTSAAAQTPVPAAAPAAATSSEDPFSDDTENAEKEAAGDTPTDDDQKKAAEEAKKDDAKKKQERLKKKQQRLQKIQKLGFDRRPSAILKAWSESLAEDKPDDDDEQAKPDPPKPAQPAPAGQTPPPMPDPFDGDIKIFQEHVTLGNWSDVKHYLIDLPDDEGKALYRRLLQALRGAPQVVPPGMSPEMRQAMAAQIQQMSNQRQGRQKEQNTFTLEDVIQLAGCAPMKHDDATIASLGGILGLAIGGGSVVEKFVERLNEEVAMPSGAAVSTREAAKILFAAGRSIEAGQFLPTVEKAKAEADFEALNLLSRYLQALSVKEESTEHLELAWEVTQAVLAAEDTEKAVRERALQHAVSLAPKVREELGQTWLEESFTGRPERGIAIIATIGSTAARSIQQRAMDPNSRLKSLQLQTTAVEALIKSSPEQADSWQDQLSLLARNWLLEASVSYRLDESTRRGPSLRRDSYGNYFYYNANQRSMQNQRQQIRAIKTGELLETMPSDQWLNLIDANLMPKFDMTFAQLYLKVNEEDEAFPYIESLATVYPKLAEQLVDEFLRVWTTNHDPNANRNRTNYYMYMYGYERKAESIPLTRSKQDRNLRELADLVKRLRALPLDDLDEKLLARAFTTCHSSAEVYRLEAIENVFGSLEDLDPNTLAELTQQMRANLAGVWRSPAVQKDKKTKRKQRDIQAEVLRGYSVAQSVIQRGLENHPDHWGLTLSHAAIVHDKLSYQKELAPDSKFSEKLDATFAGFQKAAELYKAQVGDLDTDEETTRVYTIWYYASLGACDLNHVTDDKVPDLRQAAKIRDAILALPGEAAERHMTMFANSLFTRMSAVKPAVKFRYVRTGLEIVGDHKQAIEARKVYDYYKDLITELKIEAVIDGTDVVGHKRPFGVFINLRHTREIERESGGFGRYLQNQNSGSNYYYNYGRPLTNYRDKFEEIVQQSLEEHFEVLSVTFQSEKVNSKATAKYGWRVTPYAYLLLKARGAEVDKLPSMRLDLDFLDTSGYAIIPIESPAVPLDASSEEGDARPIDKLDITQTLDERQADEGKLILEVKAVAQGLIPELDELLDIAPEGFDVTEVDDQGLSVSRFDPDSDDTVVVADRTWMISMQAKEDLLERPKSFQFGKPKLDTQTVTYERYNDADLLSVEQTISLEEVYGETSYAWAWTAALSLVVVAGIVVAVIFALRRTPEPEQAQYQLPENITAFTVLGLLKDIQRNNGFNESGRTELQASIHRLEHYFFVAKADDEPNLKSVAESWIHRAL